MRSQSTAGCFSTKLIASQSVFIQTGKLRRMVGLSAVCVPVRRSSVERTQQSLARRVAQRIFRSRGIAARAVEGDDLGREVPFDSGM